MRDLHRFIRKKLNDVRKKHFRRRKKSNAVDNQTNDLSKKCNSFQCLGYYECERLLPSSNRGFLVYDLPSIEHQTPGKMLEGFRRTFTPMDLTNDPQSLKIYWIELLWRGQIPLYEHDHGGFHMPKRLKQTVNNRKFTVTVDRDFPVRFK
jgi:hypothetical protein